MTFTEIKGYSKYEISPTGMVRNRETKKALTPEKNGKYVLYPDGDKLKRRVDPKDLIPIAKKITTETKIEGHPGKVTETIELTPERQKIVDTETLPDGKKATKSWKMRELEKTGLNRKEIGQAMGITNAGQIRNALTFYGNKNKPEGK